MLQKSGAYLVWSCTLSPGCTFNAFCLGFYGVTYIKGFRDKFNIDIDAVLNLICSYIQLAVPFMRLRCSHFVSGTREQRRSARNQAGFRRTSVRGSACDASVRISRYQPSRRDIDITLGSRTTMSCRNGLPGSSAHRFSIGSGKYWLRMSIVVSVSQLGFGRQTSGSCLMSHVYHSLYVPRDCKLVGICRRVRVLSHSAPFLY